MLTKQETRCIKCNQRFDRSFIYDNYLVEVGSALVRCNDCCRYEPKYKHVVKDGPARYKYSPNQYGVKIKDAEQSILYRCRIFLTDFLLSMFTLLGFMAVLGLIIEWLF